MRLDLAGKTVLVTGASKGIGLACAEVFAAEGAHLILAARGRAPMEAAAEAMRAAHGVRVSVHEADLGSDAAMVALAEAAAGTVDVLVNNAGDIPGGPLGAVDDTAWRRGFDLKVFGYVSLCRALYPSLATRGGVIVNVIGNAGESMDANYIAGSMGNAGLMAFTRALGGASLDDGVRVVGVNPGPVSTERMERLFRGKARAAGIDPDRWRELAATLPGGRATTAAEVADLVAFLASPRAATITGTIVTIDGGLASRK